jgi:simple sugar transport system permease protein
VTATVFADLPPVVLLPLVVVLAMVAGMIPAGMAGWMRARLRIHEVIATILQNFILYSLVMWLLRVERFGLMAGMEPKTAGIPEGIRLGQAIPVTGICTALVIAVIAEVGLFRTKPGLMLRARGGNPRAAEAVGVRSGRVIVGSMLLSGVFASLAGTQQVLEVHHSYIEGFSPGYGFAGIAVALLGASRPLGVVLAALFFAVLRSGAFAMDALAGIPREAVGLLEVLIILLVASDRIRGAFRGKPAAASGRARS